MKRIVLVIAICAGVSLSSCATVPKSSQQNAEEVTHPYETLTRRVTNAGEAAAVGQELTRHYLKGADASRNSRRNTNVVLLALNTYTLGSLGLGAHPDNALASALAGNFVSGLDGINNAGGEQAWLDALLKTNCITQHLAPAYRLDAYNRASWQSDTELVAAYDGLMRATVSGFMAAYLRYRAASGQQTLAVKPGESEAESFVSNGDFPTAQRAAFLASFDAATTGVNACVAAST